MIIKKKVEIKAKRCTNITTMKGRINSYILEKMCFAAEKKTISLSKYTEIYAKCAKK